MNCSKGNLDHSRRLQGGATLIEVLATVVITSIGLLGMAGLMIASERVTREAYLQTQASLMAQTLIEAMHINADAAHAGAYDATFGGTSVFDRTCESRGCSVQERVDYDSDRFDSSIGRFLPESHASLHCSPGDSGEGALSLCRLELVWADGAAGQVSGSQQTQVWIFQP